MDNLKLLRCAEEQLWLNRDFGTGGCAFGIEDVIEAEERLMRFAPLIRELFPETEESRGVIESPLTEAPSLAETLGVRGRLFIKRDSDLPIAGSVKARGGIYEVLKHTEDVLAETGNSRLLDFEGADMGERAKAIRSALAGRRMQVGSTGNLGMSIGIMSAALGYEAIVHMSSDAKDWKKRLLRGRGVTVIEYDGDYSSAVAMGRAASEADPMSYFVDDENSKELFMGYAVAALRLKRQLDALGVTVDEEHPVNLYLPCGVGGAPGGICFGASLVFGRAARCFFAEPTQASCMLAAFLTGAPVAVTELGLTGRTQADGLAVGKASALVYNVCRGLAAGEYTIGDDRLAYYQNLLFNKEGIFIEPSSAASLGFAKYLGSGVENGAEVTHIAWATGGRLVPEEERKKQLAWPNLTEVAAALIRKNGRFLICRRPESKKRGGLWEFVGGKLEPHEDGRAALVRECREELGILISAGEVFCEVVHEYPDITVHLTVYEAKIEEGLPRLLEHSAIAWITPADIERFGFCPADESILQRIIKEDTARDTEGY